MQHPTLKSFYLSLVISSLASGSGAAAVYQEVGGQVVIEAEHFHSRPMDENNPNQHWHLVPDEDGTDFLGDFGDPPFTTARGDKYMQLLPNGSGNKTSATAIASKPYVEYKVDITTTGTYRLFLRWNGFDGGSDSMYGVIPELRDGVGGTLADWYRYSRGANLNFQSWHGSAGFERTDASGNNVNATWNITKPGVYTIRLVHREDGVAVDALILQLNSLAAPAVPGPAESSLSTSYIAVNEQPKSLTVSVGQTPTFTFAAEASAALSYQWQRKGPADADFSNIAGATSASYTTPAATAADNGAQYRVVASIPGKSLNSAEATLTVDVEAPTLVSVGTLNGSAVGVRFSEPVDKATAETAGNYSLSSGTVSSATLLANNTTVNLVVSSLVGPSFTVTVNNVKDLYGNTIAANAQATGAIPSAPLTAVDVGEAGFDPLEPGSTVSSASGSFEVVAGGSDMWGNADHFHFTYAQRTGDFDLRVRVKSLVAREASTKAGFTVRESLDMDSRNLHAIVMPPDARNIYEAGTRADTAGATAGWGVLGGANGNIPATFPNSWIRLKRVENIFKAYASTDGQNWTLYARNTPSPAYPATVFVGLATTSHNNNTGQTTFAEYTDFGDVPDTSGPVFLSLKQVPPDVLILRFDEALDKTTAEQVSNYSLDQGVTISSATLGSDLESVTLKTTAGLTPKAVYTLTLNNLKDRATPANTIAPNTKYTFSAVYRGKGFLTIEFFRGISGTDVDPNLFTAQKFINNQVDETRFLPAFDTPNGYGDNYGARVTGWLVPKESGNYFFFTRSDDESKLYINQTGEAIPDPFVDIAVAEELDCCDAFMEPESLDATTTAAPIALEAGKAYGVLFLMKEGGGGDWAQVAWRKEGDTTPANQLRPISGEFFETYLDPTGASLEITTSPQSVDVVQNRMATFTVAVTASSSSIGYQWLKNGVEIPNSNTASYTTPPAQLSDHGAKFSVLVRIPGVEKTSAEATLTVTADTTLPTVLSAGALSGDNQVGIAFDEALDSTSATTAANYQVSGSTVTEAILHTGRIVQLNLSGTISANFTVTVTGVKDAAGNAVASTTVNGEQTGLEAGDFGSPGADPLLPGDSFAYGRGGYFVAGGGHDIWDAADGFHFAYKQFTGPFDMRARVESLSGTHQWAKATLMAREFLIGGSRHADVVATRSDGNGQNQLTWQWRDTEDGGSGSLDGALRKNLRDNANYPNTWLRLVREDAASNEFKAYWSNDGQSWNLHSAHTIPDPPLPATLYLGMAVTSHDNSDTVPLARAFYSSFSVQEFKVFIDPNLKVALEGAQVVITWAAGTLESSATLTGTFQTVPGATSPYKVTPTGTMFYRVKL